MTKYITTAKEARAAIGDRVEWFSENGSHHAGQLTDAFGRDVKIDYGPWVDRRKLRELRLHRMYDKK